MIQGKQGVPLRSGRGGRRFKSCHSDQNLARSEISTATPSATPFYASLIARAIETPRGKWAATQVTRVLARLTARGRTSHDKHGNSHIRLPDCWGECVGKLRNFIVRVWYGIGSFVAGVVGFISMLPVLFGAGLLVWQIAQWLKSGEWPSVPTSDALTYVGIDYSRDVVWPNLVGVQKLFNFFLDMPLCLTSFFVLGYLSVLLNEWLYKNVYVALWPPTHRPRRLRGLMTNSGGRPSRRGAANARAAGERAVLAELYRRWADHRRVRLRNVHGAIPSRSVRNGHIRRRHRLRCLARRSRLPLHPCRDVTRASLNPSIIRERSKVRNLNR
jgi:hypothetical protein